MTLVFLLLACAPETKPDDDGDGWTVDADCDDTDAAVNPDAAERCDGVDQDCDGVADEAGAVDEADWYTDDDGDGHGALGAAPVSACDAPTGTAGAADDCDDSDPSAYPGAPEVCGGADLNCDGAVASCFPADPLTILCEGYPMTIAATDGWSSDPGDELWVATEGLSGEDNVRGYSITAETPAVIEEGGQDFSLRVSARDGAPRMIDAAAVTGAPGLFVAEYGAPDALVLHRPDGTVDGALEARSSERRLGFSVDGVYNSVGSGLAVGDLDGDGQADLVVTETRQGDGVAYVLLGPVDADVRTLAAADLAVEDGTSGVAFGGDVALGDHDGDGTADLAVAGSPACYSTCTGDGFVRVYAGGPSLSERELVTVHGPGEGSGVGLSVGLVADEGGSRIVVGDGVARRVYVLAPGGTTVEDAQGTLAVDKRDWFGAELDDRDVDGDGRGDLTVHGAGREDVYFGPFSGTPSPDVSYGKSGDEIARYFGLWATQEGDYDGDGRPNLAFGSQDEHGVYRVYAYPSR